MSGAPVQEPNSAPPALEPLLRGLLERINTDRVSVLGLSGPPGSGKSTLAGALVTHANRSGTTACLLSLDDYYLGRSQRQQMAATIHPLFRQRGVPGSHDVDRLLSDLDQIRSGQSDGLSLPVFDKSSDDRATSERWCPLETQPQLVVLEGWCIGVPPQNEAELAQPINDLERFHDADGNWRHRVLQHWQQLHTALDSRLDQLWYIRVPDWNCVIDWRWQQERELDNRNLESRSEVEKFLGSFERIVNHMQDSCTGWANLVLEADHDHHISLANKIGETA